MLLLQPLDCVVLHSIDLLQERDGSFPTPFKQFETFADELLIKRRKFNARVMSFLNTCSEVQYSRYLSGTLGNVLLASC